MENYGNIDSKTKAGKQKKRAVPESKESDDVSSSMKRPKRAAACKNFKEKSFRIPKKSATVEAKKQQIVEDEIVALHLTSEQSDGELSPTRRLTDFLLHDSDGVSQPVEMLEIKDIFISGIILPLDHVFSHKEIKEKGVRCPSFGRVERWTITGYEDGSPVIWISTELAVYECVKPATSYKKIYDYFFEKASASLAVYKKLSKASGGNPDTSLDELLADVVRSMSGSKYFSCAAAIKEFVMYQGQFIYNQLVGLDDSAKKEEASFAEIPALVSLRDESSKLEKAAQMEGEQSRGTLRIGEVPEDAGSQTQDEDRRHAKLIHDEEYRKSMQRPRKKSSSAFSSNKFYIKIDEDEIANDYPLPSYYKNNKEETDELLLSDADAGYEIDTRDLPRRKLNNWALYNSDSRLISLELLPMKPCADIDVTIFGSGVVTDDDGSGYVVDDSGSSTQDSQSHDPDGMAIFLSQIKEWMIEYGAGMISVTIRTDMAWYRLGKPSKHYAPWYEAVLKTAKVGISIVTLLKEQTRVAKLSFTDVIKRLAAFQKMDKAYISSDPMVVERYVVVHGQIILQLFAEYPNEEIRRCPFVAGLSSRMEDKHHTKWIIKNKKKIIQRELNLNPRTGMAPASKREVMQATTTSLIKRIWGDFYSMYSLEDQLQENGAETGKDEVEDGEEEVEDEGEDEEDDTCDLGNAEDIKVSEVQKCYTFKKVFGRSEKLDIRWEGEILGNTSAGEPLYQQALVGGEMVAVGGAVIMEIDDPEEIPAIYLVEYMFESSDHCKMLHGRLLQRGSKTVLGNAANERELFLSNECMTIQLKDLKGIVCLEIRSRPWGHQHRKENNTADKLDWARAKERKAKYFPTEFYCKSLYSPERGGFFSLPLSDIGRGSGFCSSCRIKEDEKERYMIKLNLSKTGFISNGIGYSAEDYVYVNPIYITKDQLKKGRGTSFKAGKNIGLRAFVVCQLLEIIVPNESNLGSFEVKVRRFYRPEDISEEKAYASDIRELYYSEETYVIPPRALEGICEVRKKSDMPLSCQYPILDHIFFCELFYDSSNGSLKLLPEHMKLKFSTLMDDTLLKKKKGKGIESEADSVVEPDVLPKEMRLATLDIFAGCGGLSQGLEKAGVSNTKWAIEYEEPAAQAFKQNHPESTVFVNNCNVILRAIMERSGDGDDCISTPEAAKLAAKLDDDQKNILPLPGQVDFINGGPPCQGFSGMNRFEKGTWSRVQRQMILAFLSFADYFRPKYFLLENVRTFVSHDKRQIFQLTVASLLEMGYQVRFGILEAGTYGVSQSRKRAFIWAAAPNEVLPEWPEPMHVFASPSFKIPLSEHSHYVAVRSTASGAPFRSITVKDTIGDLPSIENGESKTKKEYGADPVSWFQKKIRGNTIVLTDHVCKKMNELNLIRCKNIPKRPGADWRDLPNESVKLSTGQVEKLIPFCLPNTAERNNNWKGLYGRLDWQGNFPTSITDPQPMGKLGMCFHPEQDRICSVRECARSQGFPDNYIFSGNIRHKHKQIGNAVPPPLAFALGRKLKQALILKNSLQHQH